MLNCSFELNGKPLSTFKTGSLEYPAFSGLKPHVNIRSSACLANVGPIPPGQYYIFDRQSGGRLGALLDALGRHQGWFALHAIDSNIDDETWCNEVKRGAFRLHPKGPYGISKGCIVIDNPSHFSHLSTVLRRATPKPIEGSTFLAYGKVTVA